ncbi:MAG TPA: NUDIX domain-containing protein [Anaerolineae bacterium]
MTRLIEKVTAFVTRRSDRGSELLLFEHPYGGIQIPAGTVEVGEALELAVLREAREETGLENLEIRQSLGAREETFGSNECVIALPATVYARPDASSFDWARLPRGAMVARLREEKEFVQVSYVEWDKYLAPSFVTMQITGWVQEDLLAYSASRHFYVLECLSSTDARWSVDTDNHRFSCFWSPVDNLPVLIPFQEAWLSIFINWYNSPIEPAR